MFVVDTNVLVYAVDADSQGHGRCRELLGAWRRQASAWYLTWNIVYEFLRICTHPRVMRTPWDAARAWEFVEALLASPSLGILTPTERHADVAAELIAATPQLGANLLHDAHTVALMREHGIKTIYTRDTDFHRFSGIEPLDPLRQ